MLKPKIPIRIGKRFSIEKAHETQRQLSRQVIREDMLPKHLSYVAGLDTAYTGNFSISAAVVLDYESLSLVESQTARVKTRFPYIPTLLSFREIPPTVAAIKKLKTQPDVFLADGQGIAHPYRLGFASHLGLILDKPTIGVAKSLLVGEVGALNPEGWAAITDKGETIGAALGHGRVKPIYVSIGQKVSLDRAIEIVNHCTRTQRIPQPILAAHNVATEEKRRLMAPKLHD